MSVKFKGLLVVALVAVHVLLLLIYTLPQQAVPARARFLAQWYVRPAFHQEWNLFAPDPPLCACEVEVGLPGGSWRPVMGQDRHYLVRRMARPLADHIQEQVLAGDTVLMPILDQALCGMVRDIGRDTKGLRFRLLEQCVLDPTRPEERTRRVTPLHSP